MNSSPEPAVLEARYTWGGDEFLFVEVADRIERCSLGVLTDAGGTRQIQDGIT